MKSELAVLALFVACSGDNDGTAKKDLPILISAGDGGVSFATVPPGVDPAAAHIDDHGNYRAVPPQPLPERERRAIDVTLRSSPPGARVAVDGSAVGNTPAFWSGYADGREHEFVFTLSGHAIARYRFVPVSSGVIHARLDPILDERDAGVAAPPEVVPQPQPSAVVPPAAPPTIVLDAAVAPPPTTNPIAPPPNATRPVGPQP